MSRERNLDCSLVDNDLHLEWTVGKDFVLNFRMKNNSIALLTLYTKYLIDPYMKIEEVKQISSYLHFCFGRDAGRQRDHLNVCLSHRRRISFSFCSLSFSTSAFFLSRLDEVSSLKVNADDSSCLHRINATTALLRCLALIA